MNLKITNSIITTLKLYLLSVISFGIFRIILILTNFNKIFEADGSFDLSNLIQSLIIGIRFDIVISGYLLILPFFILTILELFNLKNKLAEKSIFYFILIVYLFAFLICAADIPYFNYFFTRFNIGAFQWAESPIFVIKMIIQEPTYYLIAIPFIAIYYLFFRFLKIIFSIHSESNKVNSNIFYRILISIIALLLIILGIRGRIEAKSPIRIGTAYFSNNSFLNMAGLNPVFVLIRSYYDSRKAENQELKLMDNNEAIENVKRYLNINEFISDYPIARFINPDTISSKKFNVVVVIMESMSAGKMNYFCNENNLTPFLDSIAYQGIFFDNIYTAGIHTYNGIYSTLFSYPALYHQHSMEDSKMEKYNGLSHTLKNHNYQTSFFTTHDGQFDNVEGFMLYNFYDKVYSQKDYPSNKILSTLGVPDDYLFDFVIDEIDKANQNKQPFFISIMTASDHGPYIIPHYFKPKSSEIRKQIVEYADWSISKFIKNSSKKEWFENTIFVFVADHGSLIEPLVYDMPLNYHHTPLIIYAPKLFSGNNIIHKIGGQIDIYPTIMGLLNLPYINNSFGIDLLKESREFIYFSADDKLAVLNEEFYLILNKQNKDALYKYRNSDIKNYIEQFPEIAAEMKKYAYSNLQTAQYILKNKKSFYENK